MVYEWEHHKDVCYDLYIVQRKPLDEIMSHMKSSYNFTPSKRAFQVQFKKWDFPSKQNPAHRNTTLVARVKELWEANLTQREMLATLNEEGYELKERELMRVRAKNRWLLRVPNGMKEKVDNYANPDEMDLDAENMTDEQFDSLQAQLESAASLPAVAVPVTPRKISAIPPPLSEEEIKKRKDRRDKLLEESEKRMAAKKRRRRTKEWAGLPADPEGLPPRFPSETTLEESKVFLELSNESYRATRDQFQAICQAVGVIKKTTCGAEEWAAVKDQLVRENLDLQNVFWNETQYSKESKNLALDVICTDVTKRMRTLETRLTIADAKNTLGINPEQSRQVRNAFYNILKADHFESKLAAGDEHWKELKEQWLGGQPLLQEILAPGNEDPEHGRKQKAVEVLCRDVMKRLRDDHIRARTGPNDTVVDESTLQPSPEPDSVQAGPVVMAVATLAAAKRRKTTAQAAISAPVAAVAAAATRLANANVNFPPDLSNLDPSLLANPAPAPPQPQEQEQEQDASPPPPFGTLPAFLRHHPDPPPPPSPAKRTSTPFTTPIPIYIRPHISSTLPPGAPSKMFLASLSSPTLNALVMLIEDHWPGVSIERIDGVEKPVGSGQEMKYLIEESEELEAYLVHTEGRKSAFSVVLRAE